MNRDYAKRNKMLGIPKDFKWLGGIAQFNNLDNKTLRALIDERHIDLGEAQNDSPTTGEFLKFMDRFPEVKAHGYAVSHKRDDYRLTLCGLECELSGLSPERAKEITEAFAAFNSTADELTVRGQKIRSWWD